MSTDRGALSVIAPWWRHWLALATCEIALSLWPTRELVIRAAWLREIRDEKEKRERAAWRARIDSIIPPPEDHEP